MFWFHADTRVKFRHSRECRVAEVILIGCLEFMSIHHKKGAEGMLFKDCVRPNFSARPRKKTKSKRERGKIRLILRLASLGRRIPYYISCVNVSCKVDERIRILLPPKKPSRKLTSRNMQQRKPPTEVRNIHDKIVVRSTAVLPQTMDRPSKLYVSRQGQVISGYLCD